ncbi:MAG: M6 family metalloprotease domain-containing protein [Candidatus Aegiribacteria sp.]
MKIIIIPLLFLTAMTSLAVPPPPWFMEQADGGAAALASYMDAYADARSRGVDAPNPIYGPGNPPFGPRGAMGGSDAGMNVLVLLVDFSDNVAQTPSVYFDSLAFAADTFSLKNYYGQVSFGQIDIVTVDYPSATGWQRAPETYDYYVGGNYGWGSYPANTQGMVEDICQLVDPVVDFSQYDNDFDGYVDGVNVIYAGPFDGTPQTIWPHAWSLPGGGVEFDGVTVYSFSVQDEYNNNPGDKSANTLCHEFGHVMGLPDLYDYDYDSFGIGDWGMMSFGLYNGDGWSPAHFCAWSRIALGIAEPVNVTSPGWYDVPSVEESGTIYRLWTGGAAGNQYFLVENRRPSGYDAALPGHGLLIWHIDDSVNSNDNQWYPGYTSYGHFRVALEQADGLWQLEQAQNYGDLNDPFPGSPSQNADTFNYWTVPDSRDYSFEDTFVEVSSIPESADTVSVFFSVSQTGIDEGEGETAPATLSMGKNPAYGSASFALSHGGGPASVRVFDLSGRVVSTLAESTLPAGQHTFTWTPGDASPGVYFARYASVGTSAEVRFVLVR